jgi:hypothetical protein
MLKYDDENGLVMLVSLRLMVCEEGVTSMVKRVRSEQLSGVTARQTMLEVLYSGGRVMVTEVIGVLGDRDREITEGS